MSLLKRALKIVDRNSCDCSDLLFNSDNDSFLCINCLDSTNKEQLVIDFENKWKDFVSQYMDDIYRYCPKEEFEYESSPADIKLTFQIEGKQVIINFEIWEFRVYGSNIPDFFDFGDQAAEFFSEFLNNPEYKGCTYESVLMLSQDFGCSVSGWIELNSNVDDNEFTYSFDRLLPMMLNELQSQWNECNSAEATEQFNIMTKCDWIPVSWFESLKEATEDPEKLEILNMFQIE